MKQFTIKKAPLNNNFTGIHTGTLGIATGELKLCGIKLYLYLSSNRDSTVWNLNPAAFANWMGLDYTNATQARAVRKTVNDGIADLIDKGYLKVVDSELEKYEFLEQKVPN